MQIHEVACMYADLDNKLVVVKFSGGKDSTASLLYMLMNYRVDYVLYQHIPDNMLPEAKDYISSLADAIMDDTGKKFNLVILESEPMLKLMREKHKPFPTPKTLWCSYWLKVVPSKRWIKNIASKHGLAEEQVVVVVGVKKSDSRRRSELYKDKLIKADKIRTRFKGVSYGEKYYMFFPILDWTDEQVWNYIKKFPNTYKILKHQYKSYYNITQCLVCPFHSRKYYESLPLKTLIKIHELLIDIEKMDHITNFRMGYAFLQRHKRIVEDILNKHGVKVVDND